MPDAWCWWWRAKWKPKWKFQNRCLHEGGVGIDAAPEHAGSSIAAAQKLLSNRVSSLPIIIVGSTRNMPMSSEKRAVSMRAAQSMRVIRTGHRPVGGAPTAPPQIVGLVLK